MTDGKPEAPVRVLMADDSAFTRKMVKKHIDAIFPGAVVIQAANGEEAISTFDQSCADGEGFDLVMLDYMMPGKTGLEVLVHIRETNKTVPVYILTANVQSATKEKATEAGCTGFLNKTLSVDDLRDILIMGVEI